MLVYSINRVENCFLILFLEDEKQRKLTIGRNLIGGPWELVNHDGKLMSSNDFLGKWVLIYFGFTHCPDICPDEIEKMVEIINKIGNYV